MTHRRVILAAGISVALAAAACHEDDLFSPAVPQYTGGAMFQRYVSMGNSITAGFQSAGINDSTQRQSYAVLVAAAMGGDPFYYPSLNAPGCPPPFTNIFTQARVGGGTGTTCLFRNAAIPPYLSNVAVPGAETIDMLNNGPLPGTNSNPLTQLFLGARTPFPAQAPLVTVAANCAPPRADTVLVSFPYGFGLLAAGASTATTLDCTAPPVIEPVETRFFAGLQLRYNAIIQAQATTRGWAFTDSVNSTLDSLAGVANQFAPFPNSAASCSGSPFGLAFSCDGIHPNQATQHKIARKIVRAINAQ